MSTTCRAWELIIPVLPHDGGDHGFRGFATHLYLHVVPFADLRSGSPMLEPVRASLKTNEPLVWTRLHDLPDFVYFHHGIHIQKGVGCVSCHGRVDQMPLTWKEEPLTMEWCLNCHRQPERNLRPKEAVFLMDWQPPSGAQAAARRELIQKNHIEVEQLVNCSICHR